MAKAKRNIIQITPFMHVPNLKAAIDFMTDIMGFAVTIRRANYAYMERDGAAIRLLCVPEQYQEGNRRYGYYVDVHDVDALYASLKPKLDTLPERSVRGPVDRPYAVRELMVLMPDGNFMVFAHLTEEIASEEPLVEVRY
jgi:catechol 2,3-dioxygenase-like lactoylglutathione lyase family enzyme